MGWVDRWDDPVREIQNAHRATNFVRAAAARITTPLLPDDYLRLANPLWTARELRGKVLEVRKETSDSATLVIKPGWGFRHDYRPGQYVGIGVLVGGRWIWRSYSLTSIPDASPGRIAITVKANPDGFLSGHLVSGIAAGTVVRLAAPSGDFVLPSPLPPRVAFITAGSGITPVIAMLRAIARRGDGTDLVLLHSAPTPADVLFADELDAFEARGLLRVHRHYTRAAGRLDAAGIAAALPDWRERQVWACGPAGLLETLAAQWKSADIEDHLHTERFALERGATDASGGTVTFSQSGRTAVVDGATPLLQAGEEAGVLMPFGCRMGICQSCVVMLEGGAVRDLRSGAEHVEGERIQTCISVAAGDCTLGV